MIGDRDLGITDTRGARLKVVSAARAVSERLTRRPPEREDDREAVDYLSQMLWEYERTLR